MSHDSNDFTQSAAGDPQPRTPDEDRASLGSLFSDLSENVSVLVRQEVELAKAELKESASAAGKGAGLFAGAGIAGHLVLICGSLAAIFGLSEWVDYGWAALIVTGVWAIIALILALVAKKQLKDIKGMPKTAASVKKIPSAFKPTQEEL